MTIDLSQFVGKMSVIKFREGETCICKVDTDNNDWDSSPYFLRIVGEGYFSKKGLCEIHECYDSYAVDYWDIIDIKEYTGPDLETYFEEKQTTFCDKCGDFIT